jgi:hypothetical protein
LINTRDPKNRNLPYSPMTIDDLYLLVSDIRREIKELVERAIEQI